MSQSCESGVQRSPAQTMSSGFVDDAVDNQRPHTEESCNESGDEDSVFSKQMSRPSHSGLQTKPRHAGNRKTSAQKPQSRPARDHKYEINHKHLKKGFIRSRQQVLGIGGRKSVADIVDAFNRRHYSCPEPGSNECNWTVRRKPPSTSVQPTYGEIDLGDNGSILEAEVIRSNRKQEEDHIYDHLQRSSFNSADYDNPTQRQLSGSLYELTLAGPKVEEWINNQPDDIPDSLVEPEKRRACSIDESTVHQVQIQTEGSVNRETYSRLTDTRLSAPPSNSAIELTTFNSEDEHIEKTDDDTCYVVTSKWLTSILVAFAILGCLTFNKVCLLTIGRAHASSSNTSNATAETSSNIKGYKESIVVMIVIILMIPQGFSLFVSVLTTKRSQPWPTRSAIKWIIVGGIVESSCLAYLCLYAITILSSTPHVFILFMSGLFVVPTIILAYQSARVLNTTDGKKHTALFILAALLQIAGVALLFIMNHTTYIRDQFEIALAIFLLSIAWSPKARRCQTRSSKVRNVYLICRHSYRYTTVKAREKATLLMSLVHLLITPLATTIVCLVFQVAEVDDIGEGFSLINPSHPVFYFFLAQIFLTFFGYHAARLACSMHTEQGTNMVLTLPVFLATPLAIIFIEVESVCNTSFIPLPCGPQSGPYLYCLIGACVLLLLGQLLSTECHTWNNKTRNTSHVFWFRYYTGALLEPFILLSRRRKAIKKRS